VIGYDRRFLSKEAVIWMCEIFTKENIRVRFVNRSSPTPLIMYYVMKHKLHYGMMVTASHNPAIYNGIKVFTYGGRDADEVQTADIEHWLGLTEASYRMDETEQGKMPTSFYQKSVQDGMVEEIHPLNDYLDNIIDVIDMQAIRNSDLRVAIDPMYGVSLTALSTILAVARCTVETINAQHDTLFGGKMPAPAAETLRGLQNHVLDRFCDIGIATDGDADRLGVIDDQGRFLHPNEILVMLYYYLLKYKGWRGPAVRNISTTHVLDKVAESFGETCYEVPVGFKYISAKMQETDAIIGGESSGGLTVKGHIHGKDGIYAAALLVEMIAVTGKKLSEIAEDIRNQYGEIHMEERSCRFTPEEKTEIYQTLMEEHRIPEFPCEKERVSWLDGCKVYFKNGGWVSARFSGTEPLIRIFCEMEKEEDAKRICGIFETFLGL
jgi:phosphomannomutase